MVLPEPDLVGCLFRIRTIPSSPSVENSSSGKIHRVSVITEELWNLREQRLSMGSMDLGALEKGDLNDSQGVVLVVVDVSQNTFNSAVVWALRNVARKGDVLRIVGVLTHILNPLGYKCHVDEKSWIGTNKKVLENEIAINRVKLQNIPELSTWCEKAEVQLAIDVRAGIHPKNIVVEEARITGAYHVVVDQTFKKERKFFIDNLTCFVSRVRSSGGVESIRSFALSKPKPQPNSSGSTPFNTLSTAFVSAHPSLSKLSFSSSSMHGSSMSSTSFNHISKESNGRLSKQVSMASTGTSTSSSSHHSDTQSCDDLFSIDFGALGDRDASLLHYLDTETRESNDSNESPITISGSLKDSAPLPLPLPWLGARKWLLNDDILKRSSSLPANSHPSNLSGLILRTGSDKSITLSRATSTISGGSPISRTSSGRVGSAQAGMRHATTTKTVWVWTKSKDVMTASVEGGWSTFVFTPETKGLANEWTSLAKIDPVYLENDQFFNSEKKKVAVLGQVSSGEQLESLPSLIGKSEIVVMNALDWQIIPAENMVAAFQDSRTALYATASTATDAQVYLEALEKGTDGVVLQTDDISEVFALKAYLKEKKDSSTGVALVEATVTQIESVGMGDRVCVDLCNLLNAGEGLLVGSFARALFLVHSECLESNYVASRPFRVNAGPVHAYVGMAGGRTAYLSELHTGSQVMVVDAMGHSRTALVGRVKIESRPLLLVVVEVDGQKQSVLLQNAETVCLVGPGGEKASKALPVTSLKVGDKILLSLQEEARHTGIQIQEFLVEK
ncbi:uncharacterized protein [Physcomitrium patens]|uniref:3-dehydroquinate synthase n=1 Tax=Physcomitrium patens TaxID=3218 RepID=A0A2K1K3U6_PHYPA|nr:uncharacterized protein LOC112286217 isoform X1 [Physcomitrium patens]PNR48453.1 hypothetical protein PHYPA_012929 [Physcomitrium patens]|eukprot:XP_024383668.1 uncharacterized protein LOC112286217 isoform X1 [Physcomitrella patens]